MNDSKKIWSDFCDQLKISGENVLKSSLALSELDKAEGIRYLTRLLRIGLEMHLENNNPKLAHHHERLHDGRVR